MMFAGIITAGRDPRDHATVERLRRSLRPFGGVGGFGSHVSERALLCEAQSGAAGGMGEEGKIATCPETGRMIVSWARIDNRDELSGALGIATAGRPGDARLILEAFRRWGADCVNRLEGDFAFAIHDPRSGEVFLARDTFGARPLFYLAGKGLFAFATSCANLVALRGVEITPSEGWIARHLVTAVAPHAETPFEQIACLPPAHCLTASAGGCGEPVRYFDFDGTSAMTGKRDPRWRDELLAAFDASVAARLGEGGKIGAENSGGIDSSSILASAVHHTGDPVRMRCYGMALMADEPRYILETPRHLGVRDNYVLTRIPEQNDPAVLDRVMRTIGHPVEHRQATMHLPFYEDGENQSIETLLSGFGGDEFVTNQAWAMFRELWDAGEYAAVLRSLPPGWRSRVGVLRGLLQPNRGSVPAGGHFAMQLSMVPLTAEVREAHGLAAVQAERARPIDTGTVNGNILAAARRPYIAARLENCSLLAASYGVEYAWPLLDRRLVQQYLRSPAIEKRDGEQGRLLFREANRGRVPEDVLFKARKWMGNFDPDLVGVTLSQEELLERLHPALRDQVDQERLLQLCSFRKGTACPASRDGLLPLGYAGNVEQRLLGLSAWLEWLEAEVRINERNQEVGQDRDQAQVSGT